MASASWRWISGAVDRPSRRGNLQKASLLVCFICLCFVVFVVWGEKASLLLFDAFPPKISA